LQETEAASSSPVPANSRPFRFGTFAAMELDPIWNAMEKPNPVLILSLPAKALEIIAG
jgi:hypothetical protein